MNAGAAREQTALGETPNLAARLQAIADPDSHCHCRRPRDGSSAPCSNAATLARCRLVDSRILCALGRSSSEERSGRRFSAHDSSQLRHAPAPRSKRRPLVGRSQELGLLRDCWKQVREGRGRVVLVIGRCRNRQIPSGAVHWFPTSAQRTSRPSGIPVLGVLRQQPAVPGCRFASHRPGLEPAMMGTKPDSKSSTHSARAINCHQRRRCRCSHRCFRFPHPTASHCRSMSPERQRQRTLQLHGRDRRQLCQRKSR